MAELSDRDLIRVRLRFLDLIKSFFVEAPDAEKMSRWRGTLSALCQEQVSPQFDAAVQETSAMLGNKSLSELQEEYYQLFTNPFDSAMVETTASYYLSGRNYGETLAEIRGLMNEAGVAKDRSITDPEDSLVILLDLLVTLIELEKDEQTDLNVRELQFKLVKDYLVPFTREFSEALKKNDTAVYYRQCAGILTGYLALEMELLEEF